MGAEMVAAEFARNALTFYTLLPSICYIKPLSLCRYSTPLYLWEFAMLGGGAYRDGGSAEDNSWA